MGNTARRMRHSHLLLLAGATLARAFDLTCFGPGRGITLPGQDNTGTAAMVLPNDDWLRDRPFSTDYKAPECITQYYPPAVCADASSGSGCPPGCIDDGTTCTGTPLTASTCTSADPARDRECKDAFARSGVAAGSTDCPRECTWRFKKGARPDPYLSNENLCRTISGAGGRQPSKNEWVGVLSDPQNPPLWYPEGRAPDILSLINKGTDIADDRIEIKTYRQVTTWRIENMARLFVPLLERQIQTASSLATVKILSINATDPPVQSGPDTNNDGVGEGDVIDMVRVDFSLTTTWKKGEPGPWIDLSGTPQRAPDGRPGATLNLLETDPLDATRSNFLRSFWIGSTTWNEISTIGGCVNPSQCETRLTSPTDVHQTMYTFPAEPDIKTYIEYTVQNQQPCNGQVAASKAFALADVDGSDRLTADEIPVALFELGIMPPRACLDASGDDVIAGTQNSCERQETGFEFQFPTVSRCGSSWTGEEIGSPWHCEAGFPCIDTTCTGVAITPQCTGTDEDLCPPGCNFDEGTCSGIAAPPDCADAFSEAAIASGEPATAADCPAGCTFTDDDPLIGHRRVFEQFTCEWVPVSQTWVLGTPDACVLTSDRQQQRAGAASMTTSVECERESSGYLFSPTVEASCVDENGVPQLDTSNRPFTDSARCRGSTDPALGGQSTNMFTPRSFQSCVKPATCTGTADNPSTDCAGEPFASNQVAGSCPTGCAYTAAMSLATWVYSGITDEAQLRENCEVQPSGYEFRTCKDDTTGASVGAANQHDCEYASTGEVWVPEVLPRCLDKGVTPWADAGDATDEESCEYEPSGNIWYANRWIEETFERTEEAGGLTMDDLSEAYPGFVPAEGRCVTQFYRASGNSVREYKCVPNAACGERCRDHTIPFDECAASSQVVNECGYGDCTPRSIKYGNQSLLAPVFDWRCWDSCKPLPHGTACSHLISNNFLVDELVESADIVAEYVESFAVSCDDEFGPHGLESECKSMRCHHMATTFQTVCDNSETWPPCRSTCEIFVQHKSDMNLVSLDDCSALTIKINVSDPPNEWARRHCRAIQNGDCSEFPADDSGLCALPVRYPGGTPCIVDSQCESEGCPLAAGDVAADDEQFGGFCCATGLGRCSERGLCGADGLCHCEMFWAGDRCQWIAIPAWIVFLTSFVCCGGCMTFAIVRYYDDINWHLHEKSMRLEDYLGRHAVAAKQAELSSPHGGTGSRRSSDGASRPDGLQRRKKRKKAGKAAFIAAIAFAGPRKGYTFKEGARGTGYYKDAQEDSGTSVVPGDDSSDIAQPVPPPTTGNRRRGRTRAVLSLEEQPPDEELTPRSLEGTPRQKGDTESSTWVHGVSGEEVRPDAMGGIIEEDDEEEEEEEESASESESVQEQAGAAGQEEEAPTDDVRVPEAAPASS